MINVDIENVNKSLVLFKKNNLLINNNNGKEKDELTSLRLVDSNVIENENNLVYKTLVEIGSVNNNLNLIRTENLEQFTSIKNDLNELKDGLLKKREKPMKKSKPLRDAIQKDCFFQMVYKPILRCEHKLAYSRFRISIILLFYSGLRLNEIKNLTKKDLFEIMKTLELQIYQSKVNRYKKVLFAEACAQLLEDFQENIDIIFKENEFLGGGISNLSWIRFINRRLVKYTSNENQIIRSHSFRIHYVTSLLKHAPLQTVCEIVGHRSVNTTLRYNRNKLNKNEQLDLLKNL